MQTGGDRTRDRTADLLISGQPALPPSHSRRKTYRACNKEADELGREGWFNHCDEQKQLLAKRDEHFSENREMEMAKYRIIMRLLLTVGILFQGCDSDVKCRNDNGREVDWYILYKLPKMADDGLSYMYMDESTSGWKLSREKINSKSGTLANTLKPLFDFYDKKSVNFGYMLYNDQPPNGTRSASYGHSKGIVMLDEQTGVWLSHSTPKFPTYRNKDFWPTNGNLNAQTFMCVTYPYSEFKRIGLHLKYIHPYSYDSAIPTTFHEELQCVAQQKCYPKLKPWFFVRKLTSMKGRPFVSFAKYTRFGDDLYSGLIVNYLKENLYVKSWGRMRHRLPSNCSTSIPHHVYNVKKIKLNGKSFSDTVDHSKWCVTPGGGWTCIADTNREVSQMKRGGGAICIKDVKVGKAFYALISGYEQCKPASPPKHKVLNNVLPKAHKKKAALLDRKRKQPQQL